MAQINTNINGILQYDPYYVSISENTDIITINSTILLVDPQSNGLTLGGITFDIMDPIEGMAISIINVHPTNSLIIKNMVCSDPTLQFVLSAGSDFTLIAKAKIPRIYINRNSIQGWW